MGPFMFTLDTTITVICFPRLTEFFDVETSVILWVTVAYLLVSTAILLVVGRLGDLFGRKKFFLLGLALFTMGLIICTFSQNVIQLILSRIVQGIGGGMMMSVVLAITAATFTDKERGKAIGVLEAVTSAGVLIGPVLGGILLDTLGWRAIFYTRIPIGFMGIVMTWLLLDEQKVSRQKPVRDSISTDWPVIIFLPICLTDYPS